MKKKKNFAELIVMTNPDGKKKFVNLLNYQSPKSITLHQKRNKNNSVSTKKHLVRSRLIRQKFQEARVREHYSHAKIL